MVGIVDEEENELAAIRHNFVRELDFTSLLPPVSGYTKVPFPDILVSCHRLFVRDLVRVASVASIDPIKEATCGEELKLSAKDSPVLVEKDT
jgi:hypothetical protein